MTVIIMGNYKMEKNKNIQNKYQSNRHAIWIICIKNRTIKSIHNFENFHQFKVQITIILSFTTKSDPFTQARSNKRQ